MDSNFLFEGTINSTICGAEKKIVEFLCREDKLKCSFLVPVPFRIQLKKCSVDGKAVCFSSSFFLNSNSAQDLCTNRTSTAFKKYFMKNSQIP